MRSKTLYNWLIFNGGLAHENLRYLRLHWLGFYGRVFIHFQPNSSDFRFGFANRPSVQRENVESGYSKFGINGRLL